MVGVGVRKLWGVGRVGWRINNVLVSCDMV